MKVRAALAMALSLMSLDTMAAYQLIEQGEGESESYYVDPAAVRRLGAIAELRYIREFKEPSIDPASGKFVKSRVVTMLLDCQQRRGRLVSFDLHPDSRGLGEVIRSEILPPEHPWTQWVIIDSKVGAAMMAVACASPLADEQRRRRSY